MNTAPFYRRALATFSAAGLALTGLAIAATPAQANEYTATELFFSEYVEGSSYNKAIEIFNGTTQAIDLDSYSFEQFSNGSSMASVTIGLTGTVSPGDVFVIAHSSADAAITAQADVISGAGLFNGDDALVLKRAGEVVDVLGQIGFDPGSQWGTDLTSTADNTLRRKAGVCAGDTNGADAFDPSLEWDGFANNTFDGLGAHTATCEPGEPADPGDGGEDPGPQQVTIAEIQGTAADTPLSGSEVITTGVVTATYKEGGFSGVYIQTPGTGGEPKTPGEDASDGIFVYSSFAARTVEIGDCIDVEGTAVEYRGLTEITDAWIEFSEDECAPVTVTDLRTLPATDAEKEVYEGMLVHPQGTYTITNNYQLNQYGQIGLAVGDEPLYQATDMVKPGPEALAYEAANRLKSITLDDGSSWDYLRNSTAQDSELPYLSAETPMRTGSHVTFDQPVILDYRFQWNYQPTGQVVGADDTDIPVVSENDRPTTAPEVGGNLTIGAFNVLNYFDDLGEDEDDCDYYADRYGNPVATDYCEVRGAYSEAAFLDQQAKLVAAINKSDADILGLMEIENSAGVSYLPGQPRDKALATLVEALNEAAGETRWAYVPSPVVTPTNEDIIRTAYIFNPKTVQTLGASQILLDDAFADARYPLAQKFKATNTGKPFVMIANHFKSKGSGEDDGTGQGNANPSREAQAAALTEWADEMFEDEAVFLVGDFNAYSKETPIQIIEAAGYTNLAKEAEPMSATYQYQGRLGSLDHIFANAQAERLVTGAAVWDINADESIAFQYSRRNYNIVDFFTPDEHASSDHDPVLVGLDTGSRGKGKAKGRK